LDQIRVFVKKLNSTVEFHQDETRKVEFLLF
jgi:hypothetical protein